MGNSTVHGNEIYDLKETGLDPIGWIAACYAIEINDTYPTGKTKWEAFLIDLEKHLVWR
jgi:hypothetical protein